MRAVQRSRWTRQRERSPVVVRAKSQFTHSAHVLADGRVPRGGGPAFVRTHKAQPARFRRHSIDRGSLAGQGAVASRSDSLYGRALADDIIGRQEPENLSATSTTRLRLCSRRRPTCMAQWPPVAIVYDRPRCSRICCARAATVVAHVSPALKGLGDQAGATGQSHTVASAAGRWR